MPQDLLIRNARVIDGAGAPWFAADVRLAGGRIAEVAPAIAANGAAVVDAAGRYLAPGFIDAHCHDDLIFLREPQRIEKAMQGVTSIVVGNCSFSLYPATPNSSEMLRRHFSTLLGEVAREEVFGDLDGYRRALHAKGIALNLISLVGHAALRLAVMGYERRSARPAEIAAMQGLLAAQLSQGAAGLSLGLVYPPSAFAEEGELIALAKTVRAHGKIVAAHVRSYEAGLIEAIEEFVRVLKAANAPGLLSHLQSAGRPNWGQIPKALDVLERARRDGVDISFDMYPYPAGSTYILQLLPPEALEGGLEALQARLRDPARRENLRREVEGEVTRGAASKVSLIGWENVQISGTSNPILKGLEGKSMREAAQALALAPFDLMAKLIEEDAGQTTIILFQLCEDDLHAACCHRLFMVGSDGLPRPGTRPHPRAFGTFPRVIGRLAREERLFSVEEAVRKMTSAPAQRFGLADRGLVRPGMAADLVLFEEGLIDRATFDDPTVLPSGVSHVFVAGEAVVAQGRVTGALPGRVLG